MREIVSECAKCDGLDEFGIFSGPLSAASVKIETPGGGTPGLSDRTIDGWGDFDRPWVANSIDRGSSRFKIGVSQGARSRRGDRLDQARIVVLDVADARAHRPTDHVL